MLIGRGAEVDAGLAALQEGRTVVVVGATGIGKSAVLRACAGGMGTPAFVGGGLATLRWMSYVAVSRALRCRLGPGDLAAVAHDVTGVVGAGVLVLDDLHWADRDSVELVVALAGRISLLVAVTSGEPGSGPLLARLESAGASVVPLGPLSPVDADELARTRAPGLSASTRAELLQRAGGSPLIIEELVRTGEPSSKLRLILTARLRRLSPAAQVSMALMGLARRPLPAYLVDHADHLVEAGLAALDADGQVVASHQLLATAAVELLCDEEVRQLHARLGRILDEPGEVAQHRFAGGDLDGAHAAASEAADRSTRLGERAHHLALAARCRSDEQADRLRLVAARGLLEAGDLRGAEDLLDQIAGADAVGAEARLLRAEIAWAQGRPDEARSIVEATLPEVAGTKTEVEVRLRVLRCRFPSRIDWDPGLALRLATDAWQLATEVGAHVGLARSLVASAHLVSGSPEWSAHYAEALTASRREGDVETEMVIAQALATAHLLDGEPRAARAVADEAVDRARAERLRGWELTLRGNRLLTLALSQGDYTLGVEESAYLIAQPELARNRGLALAFRAYAFGCLGRSDEATRALRAGWEVSDLDATQRSLLFMVEGDLSWMAARPVETRRCADAALALGLDGFPSTSESAVLRAWADVERGRRPSAVDGTARFALMAGAPIEIAALLSVADGDHDRAVALFADAADAWDGRVLANTLRCRWGRAEGLARAGRTREAREALEELAAEAAQRLPALLGRIRTLRVSLDGKRSPNRRRLGLLSMRELEVLALVGQGLTTAEIAADLDVAPSTVEAHVTSAMKKLDARNRREAALMVARLES